MVPSGGLRGSTPLYGYLLGSEPFTFPGFRVYRGEPPVIQDYFSGKAVTIHPGSEWHHYKDPPAGKRISGHNPVVIAALLTFEDELDLSVLLHRRLEAPKWERVIPMTAAFPWLFEQFLLDFRPTLGHPTNWSSPTLWARLRES